jgi:cellulose synthase/poly-beta-1,6-N-acetylglucosamine synthase-like glycosyltransferase
MSSGEPVRIQQLAEGYARIGRLSGPGRARVGRYRATMSLTRRSSPHTEVSSVLSPKQKSQYAALATAWVLLNLYFWAWWLQPAHWGNLGLYVPVSLSVFYLFTLLPSVYLFFLGMMCRPVHVEVGEVEPDRIGRVAVITLTVPGSESLGIVRRQMLAMREISFPHDNWILVDKEHSPQIRQMAEELGVRYFCRHDQGTWGQERVEAWNQPGPRSFSSAAFSPFQTKTKAGNVNAWLDAHGEDYTHFTQLDIDHRPVPEYLDRVLGFFSNKRVAWVQAPSVYGNHEHWTARGSSEQEFVLQGPLQMGYFGFCRTPFIIGSHCTYDMAAIREIGGFQPTRAEDHLDTVVLASNGYEGVFLPEVIAVGDGPETFRTYCAQQFAWAYSMMQVLFSFTPRLIRRYSPRQALQFLFAQTWYTLSSMTTLVLFCAPLVSLVADARISRVGFVEFFAHSLPVTGVASAIWLWSRKWQFPKNLRLSWRGVALHVARWVVVLNAFVQVMFRVKKPYMITVKGLAGTSIPKFRMAEMAPYALLVLGSLAVCWIYLARNHNSATQGMLFFALEGALLFWLLIVVVLLQDIRALRSGGVGWARTLQARLSPVAATVALGVLVAVTAVPASGPIWQAVTR